MFLPLLAISLGKAPWMEAIVWAPHFCSDQSSIVTTQRQVATGQAY